MARSIGLATCSVTSAAPAPGIRRDDRDDRERDVGQELLLEVSPGEDAGDEEGDGEQERDAPLVRRRAGSGGSFGAPGGCQREGRGVDGAAMIRIARSMTSRSSSVDRVEQRAELAGAELTQLLERLAPERRDRDADLAAVGRVVDAAEQADRHEVIDRAAGGRDRDAEPLGDLGHAQLPGRGDDVQELGLGHRQVERRELGRMEAISRCWKASNASSAFCTAGRTSGFGLTILFGISVVFGIAE